MAAPRTAADRARERLRDYLYAKKITNRELTTRLMKVTGERWHAPTVGQILLGHQRLLVDDLEALCTAAGVPLVDILRTEDAIVAELRPTEARILDRLRQMPDLGPALLALLKARPAEPRPTRPRTKAETRAQHQAWLASPERQATRDLTRSLLDERERLLLDGDDEEGDERV